MISKKDLEVLRAYKSRGHHLLSVYLRLDSSARRQAAYEQFVQQLRVCLEDREQPPVCREIIQEDIDIVNLYLNTNANRRAAGLAIFSCARELFWRAYSLPVLVPSRVAVGSRFDIEPLLQVVEPQMPGEFRWDVPYPTFAPSRNTTCGFGRLQRQARLGPGLVRSVDHR